MNWLFITTRFPWPLTDGHWLRVYHLARTLRAQGDRTAILSFGGDAPGEAAYAAAGAEVLPAIQGSHVERGPARTAFARYAFDRRMARAVAEAAARFDGVVLSGPRMLQYAPEAAASGCVVADFIDDPVLEYGRRQAASRGPAARFRGWKSRIGRRLYERSLLPHITATTFVTPADCESFLRRHPQARVECVPNGVDSEYFHRRSAPARSAAPPRIVFTGYMANPNNRRAARFLVEQVAPPVWRECPEAIIQIVGADPAAEVRDLAGERVEVTGRVDDIRPYLWDAAVVALPMQSGTGIKNKLLEAWAAGAPVVATPLACQGIPARDGDNLLVAIEPNEFARRIAALLANPPLRDRLGEEGRRVVLEQFTWSAAAARLRRCADRAEAPAEALSDSL